MELENNFLFDLSVLGRGMKFILIVFGIYPEKPSLIAWHILGIPPDIIYPLMSQKLVTDRVRIDWMVYSIKLGGS
jgi:hypothetical protein